MNGKQASSPPSILGKGAGGLGLQTLALQAAWQVAFLVLVAGAIYAAFSHWAYDDPFITYRYANNLANGLGFVYNPGMRVQSTTTPLMTLLLAALQLTGADLPRLANLIGALGLAGGGLALWHLARAWGAPRAGWACLALYPTFPLLYTTLGSEMPLALALCLGAFAAYANRRYAWAGLLSGLAVLARPDALLVPALLAAHHILRSANLQPSNFQPSTISLSPTPPRAHSSSLSPSLPLLLFLSIVLSYHAFAWAYFGSPLPVTLAAKQQQGTMAISQGFAAGFIPLVQECARSLFCWPEAALALAGAVYLVRRARAWALLLAWTLAFFGAYSLLGVSRYYWYYAPLVPGFIALVGLGAAAVDDFFQRRFRPPPGPGRAAAYLTVLLVVAQIASLAALRQQWDRRVPQSRAAAEWLRDNTPAEARVGALEVGVLGYYSGRTMIDFASLIQPDVAARIQLDSTYEDTAAYAIERYEPEFVVLQSGSFPVLEAGFIHFSCQEVQRFPAREWDHTHDLTIYRCWYP